jgi:tRNA(Arg) A34 adenosine deaminase TadA
MNDQAEARRNESARVPGHPAWMTCRLSRCCGVLGSLASLATIGVNEESAGHDRSVSSRPGHGQASHPAIKQHGQPESGTLPSRSSPVGATMTDVTRVDFSLVVYREDDAWEASSAARSRCSFLISPRRWTGCTLVVMLEPCTMCAGAVTATRLDWLLCGARRSQGQGAAGSPWDVLRDCRLLSAR